MPMLMSLSLLLLLLVLMACCCQLIAVSATATGPAFFVHRDDKLWIGDDNDDTLVESNNVDDVGWNPRLDLNMQLPPPSQTQLLSSTTTTLRNTDTNDHQHQQQFRERFTSTGTTIAGVAGADFVVLGADTRATNDRLVADTRASKIHSLSKTVFACGAGTSADLQQVTRQCYSVHKLLLLQYTSIGNAVNTKSNNDDDDNNNEDSTITINSIPTSTIVRWLQDFLFDQHGNVGVNLVVGGMDQDDQASFLYAIHPHGSVDGPIAFTALGSGGMAAMGVLEEGYNANINIDDAIELVKRAITSGIKYDLGSGSQVDLCVIRKNNNKNNNNNNSGNEPIVDYTRAAIVEKDFVKDEATLRDITTKTESVQQSVNGFGNTPFAIRSSRIIASTMDKETVDLDGWLNSQ